MWSRLRDSRTWAPLVGGGGVVGWMPSPLHPSIFQRYWIILTRVATKSFDPHGNVTTPSPRDNAKKSASDWRVKRVHDNCIAVPIPGEILCKQVKLFIRTGYLNQWKNTKKGKRNRKLRASVEKLINKWNEQKRMWKNWESSWGAREGGRRQALQLRSCARCSFE